MVSDYKAKSHSPLHSAVRWGVEKTVRKLLSDGAEVDIKDSQGRTPLHWAVTCHENIVWGTPDIVKTLIEFGADTNLQDSSGITPLQLVRRSNFKPSTVRELEYYENIEYLFDIKNDSYVHIVNKIIDDLKNGVNPWEKPWNERHIAGPISTPLRFDYIPYQGENKMILHLRAFIEGYACPIWMTYVQAKNLGGYIRSGEHGTRITLPIDTDQSQLGEKTINEDEEEAVEKNISKFKPYYVFNCEQIENLPSEYYGKEEGVPLNKRMETVEILLKKIPVNIKYYGTEARYFFVKDYIQIPPFQLFDDGESYYATLTHEIIHWTGHKSRNNRFLVNFEEDRESYSREELVAEIGAAILCSELSISPVVREEHAAYVNSYLINYLSHDLNALKKAYFLAVNAVDYLKEVMYCDTSLKTIDQNTGSRQNIL